MNKEPEPAKAWAEEHDVDLSPSLSPEISDDAKSRVEDLLGREEFESLPADPE